jgi:hypothetical protein
LKKEDHRAPSDRIGEVEAAKPKRTYGSPRLTLHGDLRDMTCGATGANPESGGSFFNF